MTASLWTNANTFRFIKLYKEEPAIWNPMCRAYRDKNKINEAWNRIAEAMQLPVGEVKKKKETLLAAFRLNHRRVLASRKYCAGDVFKPIWIYYDALAAFLGDIYGSKSILSEDCAGDEDTLASAPPNLSDIYIPLMRRRTNTNTQETEIVAPKPTSNINKQNNYNTYNEDDCDLYGRLLAKKLRAFNEIDKLEVMHEIDGLLLKKRRLVIPSCNVSTEEITANSPSTSQDIYPQEFLAVDQYGNRPSSVRSSASPPLVVNIKRRLSSSSSS